LDLNWFIADYFPFLADHEVALLVPVLVHAENIGMYGSGGTSEMQLMIRELRLRG
jgi:hypothetical protein